MARVTHQAAILTTFFYKKGKASERTRKSTISVTKRKMKDMQEVFEAFYRVKDRHKKRPHTIAKNITYQLKRIKRNPPSLDTIKRYLEEEKLT